MEQSIFTKIINGEIPCHKVYEDEFSCAFMDIAPVKPGMIVVASRKQIDNIEDLSKEDFVGLWASVQKILHALRAVYPETRKIAVQVEGLDVAHAHIKLFPIDTAEDFRSINDGSEPDHEELATQAEKIRSKINE